MPVDFCPEFYLGSTEEDPPKRRYSGQFCTDPPTPGTVLTFQNKPTPQYCPCQYPIDEYRGIMKEGANPRRDQSRSHTRTPAASSEVGESAEPASVKGAAGPAYGHPRFYYRRDVPNPGNPWSTPDAPRVGPFFAVIAEFVAVVQIEGYAREYRLFLLGHAAQPGALRGLAWRIDPRSPASPTHVPVIPPGWATYGETPFNELIRVAGFPDFFISD